jgi:hypothetical protein
MNNGGDGGNTVKATVVRFPTEVRADVYNSKGEVTAPGQTMSIEDWHNYPWAQGTASVAPSALLTFVFPEKITSPRSQQTP